MCYCISAVVFIMFSFFMISKFEILSSRLGLLGNFLRLLRLARCNGYPQSHTTTNGLKSQSPVRDLESNNTIFSISCHCSVLSVLVKEAKESILGT